MATRRRTRRKVSKPKFYRGVRGGVYYWKVNRNGRREKRYVSRRVAASRRLYTPVLATLRPRRLIRRPVRYMSMGGPPDMYDSTTFATGPKQFQIQPPEAHDQVPLTDEYLPPTLTLKGM